MAYRFYLDNILLPVTPQSLEIKIKNQNKTVTLINDTEYNFLKSVGLTEISFDILLPAVKYPFAMYENGFKNQKYYLDELERLKVSKKPFRFYVSRELPNGVGLYDTDMNVSLEDYTIKESADNGFDLTVSINLKEYAPITTTDINISSDGTVTEEKTRVESPQAPTICITLNSLALPEIPYFFKEGETARHIVFSVRLLSATTRFVVNGFKPLSMQKD